MAIVINRTKKVNGEKEINHNNEIKWKGRKMVFYVQTNLNELPEK